MICIDIQYHKETSDWKYSRLCLCARAVISSVSAIGVDPLSTNVRLPRQCLLFGCPAVYKREDTRKQAICNIKDCVCVHAVISSVSAIGVDPLPTNLRLSSRFKLQGNKRLATLRLWLCALAVISSVSVIGVDPLPTNLRYIIEVVHINNNHWSIHSSRLNYSVVQFTKYIQILDIIPWRQIIQH